MTAAAEAVLPTEQDEKDDLAGVGINLEGPVSDAQLDAAVSEICRRLGGVRADLARYAEAEQAEIARIRMRYEAVREPLQRRAADLEAIGKDLAERADFGSKKKSRSVGFGSYGRKIKREHVRITDDAAAVEFARARGIEGGVKVETIEKPVHKAIEPVVIAHVHETGEVPAGFEHEAERDEPFVKAEA